ncbi:CAP domain-containing protein [Algirhabdus cladophorae]|uniref:CAP domain-containing protein n=1 Tax=Algirhabdus cladophorae TaxID=3377108 RepID=UPI003B846915
MSAPSVQTGQPGGGFNALFATERAKRGLPVMAVNAQLGSAARAHAQDMQTKGYFAHQSPSGSTLPNRVDRAGYCYSRISENIAKGQRTETEVMDAWLASPGHLKNMIDPTVREYGFAQAGTVWVLVMGARC